MNRRVSALLGTLVLLVACSSAGPDTPLGPDNPEDPSGQGPVACVYTTSVGGRRFDETQLALKKAEEMGYEYPGGERIVPRQNLDIGILIPDRYFEADSFYAVMYKQLIRGLSEQGHFGLLEILKPEDDRNYRRFKEIHFRQ